MSHNLFPKHATIVEVGPRDGLQNQTKTLSPEVRVQFINQLTQCGLSVIEAGSFVDPVRIPQMEDTKHVLHHIEKSAHCCYPVLTPNETGILHAIDAGATHVAIFGSASETFTKKNINCSVAESLSRFEQVMQHATKHHIKVRGYLSCVFNCPYEGIVSIEKTVKMAKKMIDMGCYEISFGDTIGTGTPQQVSTLLTAVKKVLPVEKIAVHFHDTYGQALVNIYEALLHGIYIIDSSIAGLGGCPYARGASGNVATEDVLYLLQGLTIETGVDMERLIHTSHFICQQLGCANQSKVALTRSSSLATS